MSFDKIHIMVDIETLDTTPSSVILSIGAVTMPAADLYPSKEFYIEIDENQPLRTKSLSTIEWWKDKPNKPKGTTFLPDALMSFSNWIASQRATPIMWCKGTDFDIAILAHAFHQCNIQLPWLYNNIRDYRTIKKMFVAGNPVDINPNAHNALADAIHQAAELMSLEFTLK